MCHRLGYNSGVVGRVVGRHEITTISSCDVGIVLYVPPLDLVVVLLFASITTLILCCSYRRLSDRPDRPLPLNLRKILSQLFLNGKRQDFLGNMSGLKSPK